MNKKYLLKNRINNYQNVKYSKGIHSLSVYRKKLMSASSKLPHKKSSTNIEGEWESQQR